MFIDNNITISECVLTRYNNYGSILDFKVYCFDIDVEISFTFSEQGDDTVVLTYYKDGKCFQYKNLCSEERRYVYDCMNKVYTYILSRGIKF